jgi:4-amino-4-deoxy-L-arabinose transferase-like glycosyltransferase
MTFLICFLGVFAIYALAKNIYSSYKLGLIAALFMILSPRIFAESFYNNKDIVFMATIAISMYTMYKFLEELNWQWLLIHAFTSAYSTDVRIMGFIILFSTILAIGINIIKKEVPIKRGMSLICLYFIIAFILIILMFPFLWANPIDNLITVFRDMSHFSRWKDYSFYNGSTFYYNQPIPWHYSIVWILITTPILFSCFMITGIIKTLVQLIKAKWSLWKNKAQMNDLIHLALLSTPILAVIVLSSTLYNGWRQLYFIYPAFVLMSVKGFITLHSLLRNKLKIYLSIILFGYFVWNTYWIASSYPLSNVYFNALVGKDWKDKWDVDYWGLSSLTAIKYILNHDSRTKISVGASGLWINDITTLMLSPSQKKRIITNIPNSSKPDYIITTYRYRAMITDSQILKQYELIHQIKVHGEVIAGIFKLKNS